MAEVQAPAVNSAARKRRNRKRVKNTIIAVLVTALLAGGAFAVWWFVFRENEEEKTILTDFAQRSSIASTVYGGGSARAANSSTITLAAAGTVLELYVADGSVVTEGDPLFVIDSPAATKALTDAEAKVAQRQEAVDKAGEYLAELQEELDVILADQAQAEADRFLTAPFSGQMRDAATLNVGDTVAKGTKIVTLVDDSKFKLSLYFSYAFETAVFVGQHAQVSVTGAMLSLDGQVEEIRKVRRVTAEGATLFEVVITVDNPGALTDGMAANATLTAADGTPLFPYEAGTLTFLRTFDIVAKTSGEVVTSNLLSYGDCRQGEALLILSPEDFSRTLQAKRDEIKAAAESAETARESVADAYDEVERARKALDDFSAVAPMSGTVVACSLRPGEEVESGRVAITIADVAVMTVDISVDERNVSYVKPGMMIEMNDWEGNMYMGTVESVSLTGTNTNGITVFPAVVKVDNFAGTLRTGANLNYNFTAAQSEDCLVIPIQCVRYIPSMDGTNITAVFLKAEQPPENALELTPDIAKDLPDGFYAVPVVTGLSDNMNVEVKEGLNDFDEVFTNITTNQADMWGW